MRIGIDIMGGDFAPASTVEGAILARNVLPPDAEIILLGDEKLIREFAGGAIMDTGGFGIVHTPDAVGMAEPPHRAFKEKPDASVFLGMKMIRNGRLDGFCSAGNTGAMLMGAIRILTAIPGIIRPAIAATIPNIDGPHSILLDVGLNPDARPDVLYQYGIIGSIYSKLVNHVDNPRIALLNIGSEEEKGNLLTRTAFQMMKNAPDFNFVGNIEANQLFVSSVADVIVCDGFVGNMILKEAEAFYRLVSMKGLGNGYFEKFNFENFGGTPILGVQGPVMIGHGISSARAISSMLVHAYEVIGSGLVNQLKIELEK